MYSMYDKKKVFWTRYLFMNIETIYLFYNLLRYMVKLDKQIELKKKYSRTEYLCWIKIGFYETIYKLHNK